MSTVLLVEDNTSHAELISDELDMTLEGWVVEVAPTLADARRLLAAKAYDLCVFDFRLPDGDGIELLREVRGGGLDIPTIFVTTASSAKLAVEAMKLGADDYVVKEEGYLSILPYLIGEVLSRRKLKDDKRALEERLQRAERAATLGYLASGLAHHINNPLATIRTFLQLLPTRYGEEEFRTKYLDMALAESERIRDLVRDIMRASTVPAEAREIQNADVVLARAVEAVEKDVERKGVHIRTTIVSGLPLVKVHGEAAMCLFVTLLQNAIRFSPDGGDIDVVCRLDPRAGRVIASVRDYGPGVPAEHREKIFEPFFTTAVDGLGMGLFVAARIADSQAITLSFDNREPGVEFAAALPVADERPSRLDDPQAAL
jgi:signal transduction histidine kinase